MKKIITFLVTIALLSTFTSACGKKPSAGDEGVNDRRTKEAQKRKSDNLSKVVPFGPDTYSLSLSSMRGYTTVRTVTYQTANEFCQSKNQVFLPKNESSRATSCTLIFRCLNEGDPELQKRPEWRSEPDITIEDRRNK